MSAFQVNEDQIAAFALDPADADDVLSASVERLVQAIIKVACRRSASAGLDGVATLIALLEATARIALSLPGSTHPEVAQRVAEQLACLITARQGGQGPGPLDVPLKGQQQ